VRPRRDLAPGEAAWPRNRGAQCPARLLQRRTRCEIKHVREVRKAWPWSLFGEGVSSVPRHSLVFIVSLVAFDDRCCVANAESRASGGLVIAAPCPVRPGATVLASATSTICANNLKTGAFDSVPSMFSFSRNVLTTELGPLDRDGHGNLLSVPLAARSRSGQRGEMTRRHGRPHAPKRARRRGMRVANSGGGALNRQSLASRLTQPRSERERHSEHTEGRTTHAALTRARSGISRCRRTPRLWPSRSSGNRPEP
jgi:hypothetical protein